MIAKTKKIYAINQDSDGEDEPQDLDSSTMGILDEIQPKKLNLSQNSSIGVKGASVFITTGGHKQVNYSAGTTAYTTYMES